VFVRPSAACTECGVPLRRNQYREQQFEDSYVEKEIDIRKRILKDYNKTEDDFSSLDEYNDYLEDIETIVFNLANGIDVEGTKLRVEQYKKENQTIIAKNRQKLLRKEQTINETLKLEKEAQDMRNHQAQQQLINSIKNREKQHESLIHELMSSSRPAVEIMKSLHNENITAADDNSTTAAGNNSSIFSKPKFQQQKGETVFELLPIPDSSNLYSYQPLVINTFGPHVPDSNELQDLGYIKNIRPLEEHNIGGGFTAAIACQRALQDAFSCLHLHKQFDSN
jgi:CDK-activating kinase assembly factor MAT1